MLQSSTRAKHWSYTCQSLTSSPTSSLFDAIFLISIRSRIWSMFLAKLFRIQVIEQLLIESVLTAIIASCVGHVHILVPLGYHSGRAFLQLLLWDPTSYIFRHERSNFITEYLMELPVVFINADTVMHVVWTHMNAGLLVHQPCSFKLLRPLHKVSCTNLLTLIELNETAVLRNWPSAFELKFLLLFNLNGVFSLLSNAWDLEVSNDSS
jgi:hypothetical protein